MPSAFRRRERIRRAVHFGVDGRLDFLNLEGLPAPEARRSMDSSELSLLATRFERE